MKSFVDTINLCGLKEVSISRPEFTWLYQRVDDVQIRKRLVSALATTDWLNLFPTVKLFT